ncbi:MAG TPA: response regulator, partial [Terriglobales bacterium]|nr:response regulator [Terriglobales bacterium]
MSDATAAAAPTVYFIDDSATMREVIKIAFRRENINVVACHDAATALAQIEQEQPDVVISDVIMPDKDGYEVCQYIKQHPRLGKTPVILMSGVVNRSVAEKAFAVKADELIRKPFQPQDLITRVKHLLYPKAAPAAMPPAAATAAHATLSSIFAAPAAAPGAPVARPRPVAAPPPAAPVAVPPPAAAAPPAPRPA